MVKKTGSSKNDDDCSDFHGDVLPKKKKKFVHTRTMIIS